MKQKKKKIIIFIIIIQCVLCNFCFAEEENIRVVLNDFQEIESTKQEPQIYSESAILIEQKTGEILYEKDIYARKYPASTTKILTAIIALEKCDLNEIAVANESAVRRIKSGYAIANIQVGEKFTIEQLIDVMMIQSANEAANVIAEHISGSISEFAKLMNQKAKEIGCLDSNFVNPNGVHNDNHYSTAYDLAVIARYCMNNEKFREIVTKMECSLPITEVWQEERIFRNTNKLLNEGNKYYYPNCIGIKTGFTTPAKNCLISASNKNGFEVISVILHAESTLEGLSARYLDTINLFEYGYNNFDINEILEEYDMIEYESTKENEDVEGIVGSIENKKNNNNDNNFNGDAKLTNGKWIKIIGFGMIILILSLYYLFKSTIKVSRDNLYNFKINFD